MFWFRNKTTYFSLSQHDWGIIYLRMDTPILTVYFDGLWQMYIPLCHLITTLSQICVFLLHFHLLGKKPPFWFSIMHRLISSFVQFLLCLVSLRKMSLRRYHYVLVICSFLWIYLYFSVYLDWWTFGLFPVWVSNKPSCYGYAQGFLWTDAQTSLA